MVSNVLAAICLAEKGDKSQSEIAPLPKLEN